MIKDSNDFIKQLSDTMDYAMGGMAVDNDFAWLGRPQRSDLYIPSALQVFSLNKCIEYSKGLKEIQSIEKKIKHAKKIISYTEASMKLAEYFPEPSFRKKKGIVHSSGLTLGTKDKLYGQYGVSDGHIILKVNDQQRMENIFNDYIKKIQSLPARCRIYDENGNFVVGCDNVRAVLKFKTHLNSSYFHDWSTELYVDDSAFKIVADRQITVYMWAGVLVVILIISSGVVAGSTINKQIKLNKLKNDFIATVSHELKTPLASMRVLADTLLEGNYKDQKQATEYLQLICKENKRLSGLIDNFLTFSRMERNKQAFEIVKTCPASITRAATDAVKTKFNKCRCEFKVEIGDDLPDVLADQDAMVTVLVNLLDNAYKYSYDDKHIELRVFKDNGSVCFRVSDNGIGLSQRAIKKIFKRFYQVDRSLSREAEGCGLGLSIAKFIVDAHKGSISIESKPGAGTIFTVELPAAS